MVSLHQACEQGPVVDRKSLRGGCSDCRGEVFLAQCNLVRSGHNVKIEFTKGVKRSLAGGRESSLGCRWPAGVRQQDQKLMAANEQPARCDKGNAILTGPPEGKDRRFTGLGFSQRGLEMGSEEFRIAIRKSRFRVGLFSQDPVTEKADLRLDPHGVQEFSKLNGSQPRNEPSGRAGNLLLNQGPV